MNHFTTWVEAERRYLNAIGDLVAIFWLVPVKILGKYWRHVHVKYTDLPIHINCSLLCRVWLATAIIKRVYTAVFPSLISLFREKKRPLPKFLPKILCSNNVCVLFQIVTV